MFKKMVKGTTGNIVVRSWKQYPVYASFLYAAFVLVAFACFACAVKAQTYTNSKGVEGTWSTLDYYSNGNCNYHRFADYNDYCISGQTQQMNNYHPHTKQVAEPNQLSCPYDGNVSAAWVYGTKTDMHLRQVSPCVD